jgi:hypothetical protein
MTFEQDAIYSENPKSYRLSSEVTILHAGREPYWRMATCSRHSWFVWGPRVELVGHGCPGCLWESHERMDEARRLMAEDFYSRLQALASRHATDTQSGSEK